jgi:hypothetical protein
VNHGHGSHGNDGRSGFSGVGYLKKKKKYPQRVQGLVFYKTCVLRVRLPKLDQLMVQEGKQKYRQQTALLVDNIALESFYDNFANCAIKKYREI